jgi:hypothetical protein
MTPENGKHYPDRHSPGCTWKVEAIGAHSKIVYLRMFRDGKATHSTMEWPLDRWPRFVDSQLEVQGQETT